MTVSPYNSGTVEIDQTPASSYPIDIEIDSNQEVSLKAVPNDGYDFIGWNGSLSSNDNPAIIVVDCDMQIIASFSQSTYTLTIDVNGSGSTTPSVGIHNYPIEAAVTVTAIPESGWKFDSWTGDIAEAESTTTSLIMDSDKTVTANFSEVKPNWWLIDGSIVGFIVVIVAAWLILRNRATKKNKL